MRFRSSLLVAVLACFCLSAMAEPKAYEVVKYKAKAEGLVFSLDYADGYPQASHMTVKDRRGQTTAFDLDGNDQMRFVPKKESSPKREIVLKLSIDDAPGDAIEGTYTLGNLQIPFTLRRTK